MTNKVVDLNKVESPCIGVCVLDINDVCEGCYRKADEIGRWSILSEDVKRDIVKASWQRAKDLGRIIE
ncbi:MAG: DUF1289 domain-containing protein [Cellvibrionales bacterium]|jgi:predicted Fe-S protein YdhL (DUF1289 family)|nr:DUF1289 domain-containing protein [Cellvibrionales bacterium]MBT5923004.1 DUF1289 domain-containing protein [Cellvibrionales bacterium]